MPVLKRQFIHEEITQGDALTLYHHTDYDNTIAKVAINNDKVYQGHNEMFFTDLFSLLEETGLLEASEVINNTEDETNYQQTMTIFGCKFCVWLNDNVFAMIKDNFAIGTTKTVDNYHNAWVSYSTQIPLNDYTITVNYNTTFIDVYVNYGDAETLPLFTLIKCHSVDNMYDFVYASKNCNGVSFSVASSLPGEEPSVDWKGNMYTTENSGAWYNINELPMYYHHIYYCDKHMKQEVLFNKITSGNGNEITPARHMTPTGQGITSKHHLFMRYRESSIFNVSFNGMKIMKPNACQFNIVFDDIGEVLTGPQDIKVLCPGRYYTIEDSEYFVPGCDEIVRGIKNITEVRYNPSSLRFFFKL